MNWLEILRNFDRRWIFLLMGIAIVLPFYKPCDADLRSSPMVKATYYTIEALQEGDTVMIALDMDPASTPELEPFVDAIIYQLKRKKVKMVFTSSWPLSPPMVEEWLRNKVEKPMPVPKGFDGPSDGTYFKNQDFAWLGFREGKEAFIQRMGSDLRGAFGGVDAYGTPIGDIPVMNGITSLGDFKLMILVGAGIPGIKEYVQQVQAKFDLRMVGACTAVSTTIYTPYFQSGQLLGLIGGLGAVAQYQAMLGRMDDNTKASTSALDATQLLIVFAILFGNIIYFLTRNKPWLS